MTEEEKKAIEYWKYNIDLAKRLDEVIINGRIEPLEKILNLIQKQETEINKLNNVIDKMAEYIEELIGSCPYDTFDYQVRDCDNECKNQMAECWKEYFMNKTDIGKEGIK